MQELIAVCFHSHPLTSLCLPFRAPCTSQTVLQVTQSAERLVSTVVTPDQSKMKEKSLIGRDYCECEKHDLTFLKWLFSQMKLFPLSPTQKSPLYWLLFQFGLSSCVRPVHVCSNRRRMTSKVRSQSWRELFLYLKDFWKDNSRSTKISFKYFLLEFSRNMGYFHLEDFPKLSTENQRRSLIQSSTGFWILLYSVSENSHPITYIPKNHINYYIAWHAVFLFSIS